MVRRTIKVEGMTCSMCAKTITNTFEAYGDISAKVNVSGGKVVFVYDEEKYTIKRIAKIIDEIGYHAVLDDTLEYEGKMNRLMKINIVISFVLSLPLLIAMFGHIEFFSFLPVPMLFMNGYFQLALASIIQFYIGKKFYTSSYHSLRKKVLGMDILVVLGTTSAYLYSIYLLFVPMVNSLGHNIYYFEISALIITMVLIGNYIEHLTKERTSNALVDLVNLGAKQARVIRQNEEMMIDIKDVIVGDEVVVLVNEKIPVDGKVIKGESIVDESAITGESIPAQKGLDDSVVGATINLGNKLIIVAEKVGSDTLLSKIIETVEEASASKPPIQRVADVVASYFVPVVVSISLVSFLIQYFGLGIGFSTSFERSVAILVISCPCALGLATPTSILVGNGLAAKNHMLYKGGEFFELANKIDAIAFDKTGTLTYGSPVVTDYVGSKDSFSYIYALEKESNHPISKAVLDYTKDSKEPLEVDNFKVFEGKGIYGEIKNDKIYIGSEKILEELQIKNIYQDKMNELLNMAKTVNFVVKNNELVSLYAVRDEIKPSSFEVIAEMKSRGIKPYMITGDHAVVAEKIASELGIDNVYSSVLPTEKAAIVKEIQDQGFTVAFVGDGINDAPALKVSDVGFALGDGTDIAINSSDVTLMSHDMGLVINAIDLSKATLNNIYQNFVWAFSYNLIAIPLAATGRLSMVVAAAAMAFSSITVVLNALRINSHKFINFKSKGVKVMEKVFVSDMTCGHCKMTIEKALTEKGVKNFNIDLETKTVAFNPEEKSLEEITKIITAKGYTIK